ncbi:hypothetical protein CHS0354_007063 [Potamilus streckersoni]|uniref:Uncharacterized protein n=1 Tax=Potamilus streckersoni TaxID=2493646 RepID=A0AAE0VM60_9BIVA|nr:hypothetical protein CHS0354_007063 [Potamilus streckersoni]
MENVRAYLFKICLYSVQFSEMPFKMMSTSVTVIVCVTLCILIAETDGRQCWYRFGRCYDKGDVRGKCGDSGGRCHLLPGKLLECKCSSTSQPFNRTLKRHGRKRSED